jgi:MFS family permease
VIAAGSLAYPAVSRAIADTTAPEDRARAFSLVYGVGSNLALILAPALGGVVAEATGLRWIYLVALVLELIALACFLGIEPTADRQLHHRRLTYRDVLACRPVVAISLFLFVALMILTAGLALLPTYLYDERELSLSTIGRLGSLSGIGGMLLALGLARSRRRVSVATPLIMCLALVPFAFVLLAQSARLWVIAVACLISGAYLMVWPLVDATVGAIAPERVRGRAFAFSEVFGGSGMAFGPILAGVLYDRDPRLPLVMALAGTVLILLPAMLVMRGSLDRAQIAIEREDEQALQRIAT